MVYLALAMIFFHILDDYCLQGWLANGKQKEWWEKNAPDEMYRHDYLMALFMHAFSWSFIIMIPIVVYNYGRLTPMFYVLFAFNVLVHARVDHMKANEHLINLVQDQTIHLVQILLTALILVGTGL